MSVPSLRSEYGLVRRLKFSYEVCVERETALEVAFIFWDEDAEYSDFCGNGSEI